MTPKKLIVKIHLWLGFTSGLLVFVISITGCILAFEQEIKHLIFPYLHAETPENAALLPPSKLIEIATAHISDKQPNGVSYKGEGRSASVMFWGFEPEYYYQVFINPVSGEVLKVWNEDEDFFHFILHGHFYLWLPPTIGQPVVATATLIFAIMLISGIILWWPKNKGAAKQRFSIKWSAKWRRLNYDLHNVLGFYMMIIGLILALTGLIMGFQWFSKSVYWATGGESSPEYKLPPSDTALVSSLSIGEKTDRVWQTLLSETPSAKVFYIATPQSPAESFFSYVNHKPGTYYKSDYYYFDQQTLKQIAGNNVYDGKYAEAKFADKLRRMNYDIHVGAILGLPGKIIVFLASLVVASLPVSGFYIWYGRRKKEKKAKKKSNKLLALKNARKEIVEIE